jgi:hypothetical protein
LAKTESSFLYTEKSISIIFQSAFRSVEVKNCIIIRERFILRNKPKLAVSALREMLVRDKSEQT